MAVCNLCPPDRRAVPDDEMAAHLRTVHPEVDADGTRASDDSTIVSETSPEPVVDRPAGAGEWQS